MVIINFNSRQPLSPEEVALRRTETIELQIRDFNRACNSKMRYLEKELIPFVAEQIRLLSSAETRPNVINISRISTGEHNDPWQEDFNFLLAVFNNQVKELDKLRTTSFDIFTEGAPLNITKQMLCFASFAAQLSTFHTETNEQPQSIAKKLELLKEKLSTALENASKN